MLIESASANLQTLAKLPEFVAFMGLISDFISR